MDFKTFEELKNLPSLSKMVSFNKEEFCKIMEPIMREQCRRIFNPTEEEKRQLAQVSKEMKDICLEWEVINPLKCN